MPPAAATLLEALERYPDGRCEDRLTEVFACALAGLDELAQWFVERAVKGSETPGPGPTPDFSITTQVTAGGEGRPDMKIQYTDAGGRWRTILSEHKINADVTDYQRLGYDSWPRDAPLVLVAPLAYVESYGFDNCITWLDVAIELDRIGTTASPDWRAMALDPDQPSRLRVLEETLSFIERQAVGVSLRPLDEQVIQTYGGWRAAQATLRDFLEMVRADPRIKVHDPSRIETQLQGTWLWFALDVPWQYLSDRYEQCDAMIALQPDTDWFEPREAKPVLCSGYWFMPTNRAMIESIVSTDGEIAAALRAADARVGLNPRSPQQGNCAAPLFLTEIQGATLAEQAHNAAVWAADKIETISQISVP